MKPLAYKTVPHYFATVERGLEAIAARELQVLGAQSVEPGFCGVAFTGDRALLYRTNLWARIPFRILLQLATFPCPDEAALYREVQQIDWAQYLTPQHTLAVTATGKNRRLNHSHFTALQVKNAIVDQQRQTVGHRSTVAPQHPDVRINIHIHRDRATVSLDSSGSSLHRRGYRAAVGQAPLKETLAAALIDLSEWQPHIAFCDPLCGSGTLPLEASLKALNIAPGLGRNRWGFTTWPSFDAPLWQQLQQEAQAARKTRLPATIVGCDRDPNVLQQAHINARSLGVEQQLQLLETELAQIEAPADSGIVLCNPPYGERLGKDENLSQFYRLLGDVLKQRFKGWTAFILSGNKMLGRAIGLKSSQRIPIQNGGLACQLMKYELY